MKENSIKPPKFHALGGVGGRLREPPTVVVRVSPPNFCGEGDPQKVGGDNFRSMTIKKARTGREQE